MILYIDSSALTKLYIHEKHSSAVEVIVTQAQQIATCVVTITEVSAAITKGVRIRSVWPKVAEVAIQRFRTDWQANQLVKLPITSILCLQANELVWQYNLRAYDAIHLAVALNWQKSVEQMVSLATFDVDLWQAGQQAGLRVWPESLA